VKEIGPMSWTKIGTVTAAILGLLSLATYAGFQITGPVPRNDFDEVAERSKANAWEIIRQEQTYIDDRKDRYEGKPIPKWLKDRQRKLDEKKRNAPPPPKK
jgi:hypothetical protein